MLRTKLFRSFVVIVALYSVLSAFVGVRAILNRVKREAQKRVGLDLGSAWAVLNSRFHEIEVILKMVATKQVVGETCARGDFQAAEVHERLERVRVNFGLDYLGLATPDGVVVMRTTAPYTTGDMRMGTPTIKQAMKGEPLTCLSVLSQMALRREADGLAERAFLELKETPHARPAANNVETRGLVIDSAVPVMNGSQVVGIVFGGVLVNRNYDLVDRMCEIVYRNEKYKGEPVGSATIFLGDCRVTTTVCEENGNRALGTRASREVADRVLDNGVAWVGEAFVVRNWCLTAYDPIRDGSGAVVGMLYVGVMKAPFMDDAGRILNQYIMISVIVLIVAILLAFVTANRLAAPIHRLVEASHNMREGNKPEHVATDRGCSETAELIAAFNSMSHTLAERAENLKALNRSYMETLGFVSHELKSPVATIINYVYLMRLGKLGPLTEKQDRAMRIVDMNSQRLVEMVRHYLNLARIENGELSPVRTRVAVVADVIKPLLDSAESEIEARHMTVKTALDDKLELDADINMVREVFDNLISNAVKYGREGGEVVLSAVPVDGFVRFSVRNTGDGIPAAKLGHLFQKFSRLDTSQASLRQKGTGLGLFITKNIVEAHGGTISAASEPGAWTEFTFSLPAQAAGAGEAVARASGVVGGTVG